MMRNTITGFLQPTEEIWKKIAGKANFQYVSVGRRRLRKAFVAVLIALMAFAFAGCAVAIHQAIIIWNEKSNDKTGNLDITFDVESSDGQIEDIGFVSPKTPEGYEIVQEEKNENSLIIIYSNGSEKIIYSQAKRLDTMGISVNNENNGLTETKVNGLKGYKGYEEKLNLAILTWCDGVYRYEITGDCNVKALERLVDNMGP